MKAAALIGLLALGLLPHAFANEGSAVLDGSSQVAAQFQLPRGLDRASSAQPAALPPSVTLSATAANLWPLLASLHSSGAHWSQHDHDWLLERHCVS
jgi:hypothetical protein